LNAKGRRCGSRNYSSEKPNVALELVADDDPNLVITSFGPRRRLDSGTGDPDGALASAPIQLDYTYVTPRRKRITLLKHTPQPQSGTERT